MAEDSTKGQSGGQPEPYPTDAYSELPHMDDPSPTSTPDVPAAPGLRDKGTPWSSTETTEPEIYAHVGHQPILEVIHKGDKAVSQVTPASHRRVSLTRQSPVQQGRTAFATEWMRQSRMWIIAFPRWISVIRAVLAVVGTRAFHHYNWLTETDVVKTNAAANLRGMVVSAKWRVAFRYSSKLGEYVGNIGLLAGFAAGIGEAAPELDRLFDSSDPVLLKGARSAAIAGTAAQRALMGAVPEGTHLIYKSLQGWCMLAGLAGRKLESGANQCIATLRQADALVQSTFKTVTDTRNQMLTEVATGKTARQKTKQH